MSEGTLWSTDLGAQLHIDTDANPDLWGYLWLQMDRKTFKEWLDPHPLTSMPLVVHATRIHCEAPDAASCEGTAPTVPHPDIAEWQQRSGSVAFASPYLGEDGVRVTRSYPADSSIMMTSVTYHWHTPPGLPDVCLRGHHDDPEVIAAVMEPLDAFALTLRLPGAAQ